MERRKLFQRLWSEEDEIVLIKGIRDYRAQKGFEPPKNMIDFHEFIKTYIHVEVSTSQLGDKVRKLKTKYKTNKGDPNFTKPHDQKMFQLAKKVWGSETLSPLMEEILEMPENVKENDKRHADVPSESLNESLKAKGKMAEYIVYRGLELMKGSKCAEELNEEWKELNCAALELFVKRMELVNYEARLKLEELNEEWKELNCAALELFVKIMELVNYEARLKLEAYKSSSK